jgi:hypothetical protein
LLRLRLSRALVPACSRGRAAAQILARFVTVGDYILSRTFGFGTEPAEEEDATDADAASAAAAAPAAQPAALPPPTDAAPASPQPPPPQPPRRAARLRAVPPAGFTRAVAWARNDFPYTMESGMEHHLVWSAGGALSQAEVDAQVALHRPGGAYESLSFVNPARLQSVTNVWHAHVICRPRPGGGGGGADVA